MKKDEPYMTLHTFSDLGINQFLVDRLAAHGITEPSPVQAEAIPAVLEGRDVLAQSQTGTGKTLAYLLPVLQTIDPDRKTTQALILAPTQELAVQILRESQRYAEGTAIECQALIGGAAIGRQVERLKRHPQLVVGTPGRIRELLALRKLKLNEAKTLVVDEVDQLFQLGGAGEVEQILRAALRDRQLLFLSATINEEIRELAQREMKDAVEIGIEPEQRTSATLEHLYFVCERDKIDMIRRIIRTYDADKALVFVNQTDSIAEVEAKLNYVGLNAGAIYGDADKTTRSLVLRRFRDGEYRVLVASDVAARGLDIEKLDMVIHLDPAPDAEHYVHRAGRTGRMGRHGRSISVVNPRETFIIRKFAKELDIEFGLRGLSGGRVTTPRPEERRGGTAGTGAGHSPAPAHRPAASPGGSAGGRAGEVAPQEAGRSSAAAARSSSDASAVRRSGGSAADGRNSGGNAPSSRNAEGSASTARNSGGSASAARRSGSAGKPSGSAGDRKADRHRDRKNKGAPKWLKNKPPRD